MKMSDFKTKIHRANTQFDFRWTSAPYSAADKGGGGQGAQGSKPPTSKRMTHEIRANRQPLDLDAL